MGYVEHVECRVYRDLIDNAVGQLGHSLPEDVNSKLENIEDPVVLHDIYFGILKEFFEPRDPA